jgi:isopentenyl-diphosphate delta-isomerase
LCDERGARVGAAPVSDVHDGTGILHKAFSVLVFRHSGREVLIQLRSRHKRLFALRWANTCCSHLSPTDADLVEAAGRRLREELGFSVALSEAGSFIYRAHDPQARASEYEHDTVVVGTVRESVRVRPHPLEVAEWKWVETATLQHELREHPEEYAPWLSQALAVALRSASHP